MKLDDGRLTFVAQQEVTALDAIHKAVLGKAACAGRVTEGVGTCISIHAPTWGATLGPHQGRAVGEISIHAPTWGATFPRPGVPPRREFQSTHPRGVRQEMPGSQQSKRDFNPRTHVGCDMEQQSTNAKLIISIHAPTWGATYYYKYVIPCVVISIHAPTWGATSSSGSSSSVIKFQSTHPRGVRRAA